MAKVAFKVKGKQTAKAVKTERKTSHRWTQKAHPPIPLSILSAVYESGKEKGQFKITTRQLYGMIYKVWRGYTFARNDMKRYQTGPKHADAEKKAKYYAEGIDKMKQELNRRGEKNRKLEKFIVYAKPRHYPLRPKLPKYADGIWLQHGSKVEIISPLRILIPKTNP